MGLINTIEASCRDCYKCVRQCPVKAIRIKGITGSEAHRAEILEELCVHDGRCVHACPQQAKKVRGDIHRLKMLLGSGKKVVASIAPSFVAALPFEKPGILVSILKKMGFDSVQETAFGAELVAREHKKLTMDKPVLSSACPAVVSLVEKHFPALIPYLSPVVSPMVAHARLIKTVDPGAAVVFIGPCIAKKDEAEEEQFKGDINVVLDFQELWEWIREEMPHWDQLTGEQDCFDGPGAGVGRLFPLDGGMLRTAAMSTDMLDDSVMVITGLIKCMDFLKHLLRDESSVSARMVELLACPGGCISGPMAVSEHDVFIRKQKVMKYFRENRCLSQRDQCGPVGEMLRGEIFRGELSRGQLYRSYNNKQPVLPVPSGVEINEILARVGKTKLEDHLNCGACGYPTCRDKAIAVHQGIAELKMCIPYMRERAESVSNLVISAMPNGVIIASRELKVLEINIAAQKMFGVKGEDFKGKDLSLVLDPANFRQVADTMAPMSLEMTYESLGLVTREIIFPLKNEGMVVGILVDVTEEQKQREQQDRVRDETIKRAKEVIAKQMQVAQEIAGLLGETTAETKVLLTKLIKLVQE